MSKNADKSRPRLEPDPRFPSGEWKGFWLQRQIPGRQWMSLVMEFANGQVSGEGCDRVGEFTLRGSYELKDGRCSMTKTYPASHDVLYNGCNEGDGKWLWGTWKLHNETGGFHLWPAAEDDPTSDKLSAKKTLPAERETDPELVEV